MTIDEIERLAYAKDDITTYSPLEKLCYVAFTGLYSQWHNKSISESYAKEQKRKIRQAYENIQGKLDEAHNISVKYASGIKSVDEAICQLCIAAKDKTIPDSCLLIDACKIIDTLLGGTGVTERVIKKSRKTQ